MEVLQHYIPTADLSPEDPGDDVVLAWQARQGDAQAFALLYRRYVDRVYAYAAWRLASREAAEEATQQIFFRALRGLPGYRQDAAFAPWLFAIARNVVTDIHRARSRVTVPLDSAIDVADSAPLPEEEALRALQRGELEAARDRCLSGRERELFDLLLTDMTQSEIARTLGRRQGAIRTAHWRLIGKLRACLTDLHAAKEAPDGVL